MYPTKKLSKICSIRTGKKDVNYSTEDGLYPFFTCWEKIYNAPDFSFEWSAILIAWNGDVGACKKYDWKFEAYQRTYVLMNFSWVQRDYLFYFLNGNLTRLVKAETLGTAIPYIKLGSLTNREIPLPPLSTQSRIVARLDATFASIDEQISLLRANIADVENMRKSVLKESFQSGEYEEVYLGNKEFIEIIDGDRWANYPKKTEFTESGFCLFLNTSNVRQWFFDFSKMDFITEEKYNKMGKWKVYKNDVILTTRWTIGNSAFVEDNFPYDYIRINSGMVILRNNLQKVSPKYIIHFINSPLFESQKQTFVSGSAQPQLPITVIKQIYIPLPPLPRQHEIVAHLDRVFATTEALRAEYEAHIRDLETLRQSLLEEAFAGRLVPENEA